MVFLLCELLVSGSVLANQPVLPPPPSAVSGASTAVAPSGSSAMVASSAGDAQNGVGAADSSDQIYANSLMVGADVWCPYNCHKDAAQVGYIVEVLRAIFEPKHIRVDYRVMPWSEAIQAAKSRNIDAVIGASVTEVPTFIFPKEELGRYRAGVFVRQDYNESWTRLIDTKRGILGLIKDYDYGAEVQAFVAAYQPNERVFLAEGPSALRQLVQALADGKIQFLVEDPAVMQYFLKENKMEGTLKQIGTARLSEYEAVDDFVKLYVAFSPRHPRAKEWSDVVTQGLQTLRQNGGLAAILTKYGLQDWQKP
jgi:polar amino acid transport system substrate-binding protein